MTAEWSLDSGEIAHSHEWQRGVMYLDVSVRDGGLDVSSSWVDVMLMCVTLISVN